MDLDFLSYKEPFELQSDQQVDQAKIIELPHSELFIYSRRRAESKKNQDSFAIKFTPKEIGLCLADGIGGARYGEKASQIATSGWLKVEHFTDQCLTQINEQIMSEAEGSGTTFTSLSLKEDGAADFMVVGDSSLAIVSATGAIRYRSYDHGPAGEELRAGEIDEHQFFMHQEKHILHNALGTPELFVEKIHHSSLRKRDWVIMASDGFWDNIYFPEMKRLFTPKMSETAENFMALFNERQPLGPKRAWKLDDITVLLFRGSF